MGQKALGTIIINYDNAIDLPGVTVREFEALLDFFYTETYNTSTRTPLLEVWIDLLSVATRFDFQRVRERAIRGIDLHHESLDPIEQIFLAEKHDVPHWLRQAYAALCQRVNPLEAWEIDKIGSDTIAKLWKAREAVRDPAAGSPGRSPASVQSFLPESRPGTPKEYLPYSPTRVERIVNEVFFLSENP